MLRQSSQRKLIGEPPENFSMVSICIRPSWSFRVYRWFPIPARRGPKKPSRRVLSGLCGLVGSPFREARRRPSCAAPSRNTDAERGGRACSAGKRAGEGTCSFRAKSTPPARGPGPADSRPRQSSEAPESRTPMMKRMLRKRANGTEKRAPEAADPRFFFRQHRKRAVGPEPRCARCGAGSIRPPGNFSPAGSSSASNRGVRRNAPVGVQLENKPVGDQPIRLRGPARTTLSGSKRGPERHLAIDRGNRPFAFSPVKPAFDELRGP